MKSTRYLPELKRLRGEVQRPASKGERVLGSLFPGRGTGWPGGWSQDRVEQSLHLRNWVFVAVDLICSKLASVFPNIAYVTDQSVPGHTVKAGQRGLLNVMGQGFGGSPYVGGSYRYGDGQVNGSYVGTAGWDPRAAAEPGGMGFGSLGGGHSFLTVGEYRSKALSVVKPHEELEPLEAGHMLRRLIQNPNSWDTYFSYTYEKWMFGELCGVHYEWLVPGPWGKPAERWVIPSHWVWPRTGGGRVPDGGARDRMRRNGATTYEWDAGQEVGDAARYRAAYVPADNPYADRLIQYYEVRPWGGMGSAGVLRIPPNEIVMTRWPSPINKIDGYSKLAAVAQWIDTEESISRSRWSQFQNQARPEFWVQLPPGYDDADDNRIARIEAKFAAKFLGEGNYGKPVFTSAGTMITPLSFNPSEMAYFQCLSADTECLTASGWKKYDELTAETLVACYQPPEYGAVLAAEENGRRAMGRIFYQHPSAVHVRNYRGRMYHWHNRDVDALMSPNHRVYVRREGCRTEREVARVHEWDEEPEVLYLLTVRPLPGLVWKGVEGPSSGYTHEEAAVFPDEMRTLDYDGIIWCVTVPTGLFIVRRNGKAHVTGNSEDQIRDMTLSTWRVPPAAVGIVKEMTYGSILATLAGLCTYCLNPRLGMSGETDTKFLASRWDEETPAYGNGYSVVGDEDREKLYEGTVLVQGGQGGGIVTRGNGGARAERKIKIFYDDCVPADPAQVNSDLAADNTFYAVTPNEVRALRGRKPYRYGGDNPIVQGPAGPMPLPLNDREEELDELAQLAQPMATLGQQEGGEGGEGEAGTGQEQPGQGEEPHGQGQGSPQLTNGRGAGDQGGTADETAGGGSVPPAAGGQGRPLPPGRYQQDFEDELVDAGLPPEEPNGKPSKAVGKANRSEINGAISDAGVKGRVRIMDKGDEWILILEGPKWEEDAAKLHRALARNISPEDYENTIEGMGRLIVPKSYHGGNGNGNGVVKSRFLDYHTARTLPEHADEVVAEVRQAAAGKAGPQFAAWCKDELRVTVSGSRANMLTQAINYVNRAAVSQAQVRFGHGGGVAKANELCQCGRQTVMSRNRRSIEEYGNRDVPFCPTCDQPARECDCDDYASPGKPVKPGRRTKAFTWEGVRLALPLTTLAAADFVKLPDGVEGTNCMNCRYESQGQCWFPDLAGQEVTERTCCKFWDAPGTGRPWQTGQVKGYQWVHPGVQLRSFPGKAVDPETGDPLEELPAGRKDPVKIHLPELRQGTNYSCGASALQAVCEFFGVGPQEEGAFIELLPSDPENGTDPSKVIALGHKLGLDVAAHQGMSVDDLKKLVDRGQPVMVLVQAWYEDYGKADLASDEDGHYVVVIGYDKDKLYFADPAVKGARSELPPDEFLERWHDKGGDGRPYVRYGIAFWRPSYAEPMKGVKSNDGARLGQAGKEYEEAGIPGSVRRAGGGGDPGVAVGGPAHPVARKVAKGPKSRLGVK